ncbi:hypothetical protein D3C85_1924950 [compost metagenome]
MSGLISQFLTGPVELNAANSFPFFKYGASSLVGNVMVVAFGLLIAALDNS